MPAHLLQRGALAEAGHVGVLARALLPAPRVIGVGDAGDLLRGQFAVGAVDHAAELARVDEQQLPAPVAQRAVAAGAGQEPQAGRDLRRVEQLPRQRHHAVDQVGLEQVPANGAFAGLVR